MSTARECLTIPAVVTSGYVEKGSWTNTLGELPVYVTGNEKSSKAVVTIYDIFGIAPQTIQGADLLAAALDALVLMPDFFKGAGKKNEWVGEEHKEQLIAFYKISGDRETHGKNLLAVVEAGNAKWGSVKSWGAYGLCWGGKLAVMNSATGTPFSATGQVHPGSFAKEDAEKVVIPHIVLPSKDENSEVVKAYEEILTGEGKTGEVEVYPTMHHGWMGARADLENPENLKEYTRGYNQLAAYFAKHL